MNEQHSSTRCSRKASINKLKTEFFLSTTEEKASISPLMLKRSSFIRYDDSIPFVDANIDKLDNKYNIVVTSRFNDTESNSKSTIQPIFKTGSISSLKTSALSEYWPSSEFVNNPTKERLRTQSTCDRNRSRFNSDSCKNDQYYMRNNDLHDTHSNGDNLFPISNCSSINSSLASTEGIRKVLNVCRGDNKSVVTFQNSPQKMSSSYSSKLNEIDFTDLDLLKALEKFVKLIPVVGESQERERILLQFSERFHQSNNKTFVNLDACHTLVCALMLLNTDLHSPSNAKRMTCSEFVCNILKHYPEYKYSASQLSEMYNYIRKNELKYENSESTTLTLRRKISKMLTRPAKPHREASLSTSKDTTLAIDDLLVYGNVLRKRVLITTGKKPPFGHRGWKIQFAAVIGLKMFLFRSNSKKLTGYGDYENETMSRMSISDSNRSLSKLGSIDADSIQTALSSPYQHSPMKLTSEPSVVSTDLNSIQSIDSQKVSRQDVLRYCQQHSTNDSVSNGNNSKTPNEVLSIHHAFAEKNESVQTSFEFILRLVDKSVYKFRVGNQDDLIVWIDLINFAAATLSAPPIPGIGSTNYYKPMLPEYQTDLNISDQIESHKLQLNKLTESLTKIEQQNFSEDILNQMRQEIRRYQVYLSILQNNKMPSQLMRDNPSLYSLSRGSLNNLSPTNSYSNIHNGIVTATLSRRANHNLSSRNRFASHIQNNGHNNLRSESASRIHSNSAPPHQPRIAVPPSPTSDCLNFHQPLVPYNYYFNNDFNNSPLSFSRFIDPRTATTPHQQPLILSPLTPPHFAIKTINSNKPPPTGGCTTAKLPRYSPPTTIYYPPQ